MANVPEGLLATVTVRGRGGNECEWREGGAVTEGERVCMDGGRGGAVTVGEGGGRGTVTVRGRGGNECEWREGGSCH